MTITGVELKSENGTKTRQGATYTRVLQISFTAGFSAAAVFAACTAHADSGSTALLKDYGDTHPDDSGSVVTQLAVKDPLDEGGPADSGDCDLTITFSPFDASFVLSPLDRPPEVDWGGGEDQTEVMHKDYDDTAVKNSAGDRYDPMPEREVPGADVTITRYEADNPADVIAVFSKTTNSGVIWGQATDAMKMGKIRASKVYENNVAYWKVSYPVFLTSKAEGWRLKLIDNGYRKLVSSKPHRITDETGHASPVPCLLDGSGGELAVGGTPVVYPSTGFKQYPGTSWAALSLPNPFA